MRSPALSTALIPSGVAVNQAGPHLGRPPFEQRVPGDQPVPGFAPVEKAAVPVKTLWSVVWLSLAILFNNIGNMLVKHFADVVHVDTSPSTFLLFIAAGTACAAALVFYTKALANVSLSVAYPILVGATLAGATLAGFVWFHEPLSHAQYGGVALIFLGIILLSANGRKT